MKGISAAIVCLGLAVALRGQEVSTDDRFLAGYATAVLARDFALPATGLSVVAGALRYEVRTLGTRERERLERTLRSIPGLVSVTLVDGRGDVDPTAGVGGEAPTEVVGARGHLFDPLLADPRWPHFFASYNYYDEGGDGGSKAIRHVGSVGFGETLTLLRERREGSWRWEAGLQAGVFAVFDLDSESMDLVNADYLVGPYAAVRRGDLSAFVRLYHQSSHLGDEYILREDIAGDERVNLSYEALEVLLSHEIPGGLRLYGGGGYLLHSDPDDLRHWSVQYGGEWQAPFLLGSGSGVRPIFAVDVQNREEDDWAFDYSVRAGVRFEELDLSSQRLDLMLEYYDGRSPNGQFYTDRIEFLGVGLHFHF